MSTKVGVSLLWCERPNLIAATGLYGDVLENEPATATAQRPVKSALPLPKPAKGKKVLPKQQQPAAHAAAAATKSESARSGVGTSSTTRLNVGLVTNDTQDSILDKFFPRDKEYSELLATPTPPSRKRKVAASASDSSLAPVPSTQGKRTKLVDTASADFSPTPLPKASRGKTPTSTKKSYMWDALSSGEVSPTDQGPKRASASEKVFSVATPTRAR